MDFILYILALVIGFFLLKLIDLVHPFAGDARIFAAIFAVWIAFKILSLLSSTYVSRRGVV